MRATEAEYVLHTVRALAAASSTFGVCQVDAAALRALEVGEELSLTLDDGEAKLYLLSEHELSVGIMLPLAQLLAQTLPSPLPQVSPLVTPASFSFTAPSHALSPASHALAPASSVLTPEALALVPVSSALTPEALALVPASSVLTPEALALVPVSSAFATESSALIPESPAPTALSLSAARETIGALYQECSALLLPFSLERQFNLYVSTGKDYRDSALCLELYINTLDYHEALWYDSFSDLINLADLMRAKLSA